MGDIKVGDVVRASFATSGRVVRIVRFRGQDTVVLDTGEGAHRKIPVNSLTAVPTCENQRTRRDDAGEVTSLEPCQNPPDFPTRRGIWLCRECQAEAKARVSARGA